MVALNVCSRILDIIVKMKFIFLIPILIIYIIKPVENFGFLTGVVKRVMQFPTLEEKLSKVYLEIFFPKVKKSCLFPPIRRDGVEPVLDYDVDILDNIDADSKNENNKKHIIHSDDRVLLSECEHLVEKINFNIGARTVLLLPGYRTIPDNTSIQVLVKAYLKRCDHYVIVLNWINMTGKLPKPFFNAQTIARELGKCFSSLEKKGYNIADNLHIVGFSFGGPMAGIMGHHMVKKPHRITGLDPTHIYFSWFFNNKLKLDPSDAQFVDIIHTDMYYYGVGYPSGHVDFLVNSGHHPQPGCENRRFSLCNHLTSVFVYAESITQNPANPTLLARKCDSWKAFINGMSDRTNETIIMGPDLDASISRHSGVYCLHTNSSFTKEIGKGIEGSFGRKNGRLLSNAPKVSKEVIKTDYEIDTAAKDKMVMDPVK
ncbi:phospholipase A1 member A-like isoform X2 [Lycorma delicatula]|uniref:phospholipase A1 member A-like isoform X2 n=1 Tax=Lycorma delicatula TaxID=130591 RepID=UPI003F518B77